MNTQDVIDRLRGNYKIGPNGEYGMRSFADFIPPISFEAADVIESLQKQNDIAREALETISIFNITANCLAASDVLKNIPNIAQTALEEMEV